MPQSHLSHKGQNLYQLRGRFGKEYGGRLWRPGGRVKNLAKARRVYVWAPFLSRVDREQLGAPEKAVWCRAWHEILGSLLADHGAGTEVGVYPYAATQMNMRSLV